MSDAPPVVTWYKVYAGLMAAMYLLLLVGGASFPLWAPEAEMGADDPPPWVLALAAGCISLPFAAAYVAAFVVPVKPWAWIYHLVLICFGLTSACCMLASIPLLIFWLRPETKAYFGRA
jgi:hypothetical protein